MDQTAPKQAKRRTQSERSGAMRSRLATAAYETVEAGGLGALRMRNVATAAGVSQGALLHHFPDKKSLTLIAIEQALTLAKDDSIVLIQDKDDESPEALLRLLLDEFRQFFFSGRFWVAMGITLEAAKDDDLFTAVRAKVADLRSPIYAAWADRLTRAGWTAEAAIVTVRSAATLVSGSAIRRFWADPDDIGEHVKEEWLHDQMVRRQVS